MQSIPLVLALPAGTSVKKFAEGCRNAALDFVNRISVHPDKERLVEWLSGPYRKHVVALAGSNGIPRVEISNCGVAPGVLDDLLTKVRCEVLLTFARARDPEDAVNFAFSALSSGLVYRCQDAERTQGWVPVSLPRMRLIDRVFSLVAADFLMNGDDYEHALFTCTACGSVTFDAQAKPAGLCRDHTRRWLSGANGIRHAYASSDTWQAAPQSHA